MRTVQAFLVLAAAMGGTLIFVADPIGTSLKLLNAKKVSDVSERFDAWFGGGGLMQFVVKSWIVAGVLALAVLYLWILEPLAMIFALVNKIGYQPAAYGIAAIMAIAWTTRIRSFKKTVSIPKAKEELVEYNVAVKKAIASAAQINATHVSIRRVFFSLLPALYMWYLFFVLMGVFPDGGV